MPLSSNNTNKLSPQERACGGVCGTTGSNNTNKLSPQEPFKLNIFGKSCSNNTNKLSPQERTCVFFKQSLVQIIQINLVLKNKCPDILINRSFK